jgi:hypothetical protein
VGTGRPKTQAAGWEYEYHGHLTHQWPNEVPWGVVDQRQALVGSVIIRAKPRGEAAPVGSVYPFFAAKMDVQTFSD